MFLIFIVVLISLKFLIFNIEIFTMSIKERFHKLIDSIEDERDLQSYYLLIDQLQKTTSGKLFYDLSKAEKEELLLAYNESYNNENLISHDVVKEEHSKWLKK